MRVLHSSSLHMEYLFFLMGSAQVDTYSVYVLMYELLMGQGLGGHQRRGAAEKLILQFKVL